MDGEISRVVVMLGMKVGESSLNSWKESNNETRERRTDFETVEKDNPEFLVGRQVS